MRRERGKEGRRAEQYAGCPAFLTRRGRFFKKLAPVQSATSTDVKFPFLWESVKEAGVCVGVTFPHLVDQLKGNSHVDAYQ